MRDDTAKCPLLSLATCRTRLGTATCLQPNAAQSGIVPGICLSLSGREQIKRSYEAGQIARAEASRWQIASRTHPGIQRTPLRRGCRCFVSVFRISCPVVGYRPCTAAEAPRHLWSSAFMLFRARNAWLQRFLICSTSVGLWTPRCCAERRPPFESPDKHQCNRLQPVSNRGSNTTLCLCFCKICVNTVEALRTSVAASIALRSVCNVQRCKEQCRVSTPAHSKTRERWRHAQHSSVAYSRRTSGRTNSCSSTERRGRFRSQTTLPVEKLTRLPGATIAAAHSG